MHCSVELLFQLYIEVINWKDYKINCTVQIVVGMENRAHYVGNRRQMNQTKEKLHQKRQEMQQSEKHERVASV